MGITLAAEEVIESHAGKSRSRFRPDLQKVIEGVDLVSKEAVEEVKSQSEFKLKQPPTLYPSAPRRRFPWWDLMRSWFNCWICSFEFSKESYRLCGRTGGIGKTTLAIGKTTLARIAFMRGIGKTTLATIAFMEGIGKTTLARIAFENWVVLDDIWRLFDCSI